MAKNTYKQPSSAAPGRANEPRPAAEPRAARNQPRSVEPEPVREARRNEPARASKPAAPKAARKPLKLPAINLSGLFGFLRDRRFQLFLGFFFLIGSIYLTIAFISFLFTGHADQSVTETVGRTPLKEAGQETGNWLGLVGAMLAQFLIQDGFGVAAFAAIPIVFFIGYKIVFRRAGVSFTYVLALCLFTMLWLSVLMGYVVLTIQSPDVDPALAHSLDFLCGGVGYETAFWLDSLIGWGTVLLLAFLLISFVVFFFNVTSLNLNLRRSAGEEDEDDTDEELAFAPAGRGNFVATPTAAFEPDEPQEDTLGITLKRVGPLAAQPEPQEDEQEEDSAPQPQRTGPVAGAAPAFSVVSPVPAAAASASVAAGGLAAASAVPVNVAATAGTALTGAAAALVATPSSGPSFSIEMPEADVAPAPVAPKAPAAVASVPTPLSLADLVADDTPLPAPVAPVMAPVAATTGVPAGLSFEVEDATTSTHELDPSAGADMAVIAEEDEEEEAMPTGEYDPTLDLPRYQYPTLELLNDYGVAKAQVTKEELEANKDRIVETLGHYGINIASIKATIGPTVTLYEIVPDAGVRISKIKSLEDDIALSLAALGIRIIAPIPGKGTIGIEVPNTKKEMVSIRSVFNTDKFVGTEMDLPIAFGRTITNEVFVVDLAKMPHLLMAGATGQGKSVGLNVILASLLYKRHPSQLKFVLVDPKKVELSIFNKIERHFLAKLPESEEPIITDTKKVVNTLNSLCMEMDKRYDLLKDAGCRNLKEYNRKFVERRLNPKKGHRYMPFIVLVIDELADLMMTAGKEVETPIARLAQLARAIGIHLIVATQRPSVNVITGIIKANFPCRISFKVTSKIDSRTILDAGGADQLIGQGDMLISQGSDIIRVQCAFIDTPEVDRLCDFVGEQQGYPNAYELPEVPGEAGSGNGDADDFDPSDRDSMFEEAARVIVLHQQGSTSLIQRKLKLGYNRAGRLIDQLEHAGIVGPFEGSKAREVLIPDEYSLEQLLNSLPK
ncbi:S-DNA-T family DNA segregation ATPase FtsK/SpoIIIE [Hymenobacter luteus]|uniref:S-DNA-T family DNA segregation ATPase FtsK/SpoIIIE n=2 Tax=Hymenobacter TaxID=89966 RepID=A0A7W9T2M5_9BACT|nr:MULTISPECIES: DNA translocase FtsK [Hymenobacter]MBB4602227.1 S-DNA-T family DNA segregation ATPase FtsK/SpoIIIE [Hymenobacter latericoloratus]MBB6059344.1 S-DNA-T family DNA segregation ATPase FtsK/SpoIIIE [Hymenobacter luteus]